MTLRQMMIEKYESMIDYYNEIGAWQDDFVPEECPDFASMDNRELFDKFLPVHARSSAPGG